MRRIESTVLIFISLFSSSKVETSQLYIVLVDMKSNHYFVVLIMIYDLNMSVVFLFVENREEEKESMCNYRRKKYKILTKNTKVLIRIIIVTIII